MKTIACLAVGIAALAQGCRNREPPPPTPTAEIEPSTPAPGTPAPAPAGGSAGGGGAATPEHVADIGKLCNVLELAGVADADEDSDRMYIVATWLAANLTTSTSRAFLAQIQPLTGAPKADALDAEARRVGLAACPLSATWRAR